LIVFGNVGPFHLQIMAIFSIALNIKLIHHVCSTYLLHSCVIVDDNTILQGLGPNVNFSAQMPVLNILFFKQCLKSWQQQWVFFELIFILQFFLEKKLGKIVGFQCRMCVFKAEKFYFREIKKLPII
jgi:hypothetical protein